MEGNADVFNHKKNKIKYLCQFRYFPFFPAFLLPNSQYRLLLKIHVPDQHHSPPGDFSQPQSCTLRSQALPIHLAWAQMQRCRNGLQKQGKQECQGNLSLPPYVKGKHNSCWAGPHHAANKFGGTSRTIRRCFWLPSDGKRKLKPC